MFSLEIETLARLLIDECRQRSLRIVTAESCTGGLVAGAICAVAGGRPTLARRLATPPDNSAIESGIRPEADRPRPVSG